MRRNIHRSAGWLTLYLALGSSAACSTAASPDQRGTGSSQQRDGSPNGGKGAVPNGGGAGTAGGFAGSGGTSGGGSGGSRYQHDAGTTDAGSVCGESVSDYCARATGSCITEWPTDVTAFCPPVPRSGFNAWTERCGLYRRARVISNVDVGGNSYYDITTGQLIAIVAHYYSGGEARCDAGPARFVEPRTCDESVQICFDVGSGGAGSGGENAGGSSGKDAGRQDAAH